MLLTLYSYHQASEVTDMKAIHYALSVPRGSRPIQEIGHIVYKDNTTTSFSYPGIAIIERFLRFSEEQDKEWETVLIYLNCETFKFTLYFLEATPIDFSKAVVNLNVITRHYSGFDKDVLSGMLTKTRLQ